MPRLRLIPREESFFDLFELMAQKVQQGADALVELLEDYSDLDRKAGRVLDIEHEGDEVTHEVMRRLNTTFITPFDREDIHRLASSLDDVLDHVEAAAEYLQLHRIDSPLPQMLALAEILQKAASTTATAMPALRKMKDLEEYWVEINRLENDGDRITREAIASLFDNGIDPMVVIRWKDIFERLENAIDATEQVANIIEGIVIKNA